MRRSNITALFKYGRREKRNFAPIVRRWPKFLHVDLEIVCPHIIAPVTASDSEQQILAARAAINRAIAARDAAGIAACLHPDYDVVTSRGVHRHGREASVEHWAALFANDPHATYVRTPDQVLVHDDPGMAHEQGRWTGTHSMDSGPVSTSGVYAARWRRVDGGWRLEAEIFTPLGK